MVVVAPGPEAVEGRDRVPDQLAIAQPAALLNVRRHPEPFPGLAPDGRQTIAGGIARPRTAFAEDFHLHVASVTIGNTPDLARTGKRQQRGLGLRVNLRRERAKL